MDARSLAESYLKHYDQDAPVEALWSFQYAGELRKKRLDKFGLRRASRIENITYDRDTPIRNWEDERYREKMFVFDGKVRDVIYKGEKRLYDHADRKFCYATVIDLKDPATLTAEDLYSCPHCGAVSKVSVLLDGCPFCGTHFKITELYPKVDNSYTVLDISDNPDDPDERRHKRIYLLTGIVLAVALRLLFGHDDELIWNILGLVFAPVFGLFFGYLFWGFSKLFTVFSQAGKSIPLMAALKSGKKFEQAMSQYSSSFTYEHFTGQMLSLMQILIFSDDDRVLPFYQGEDRKLFSDVIDCSYRGGLKLESFQVKDKICTVRVKAYLENLHYDGKRVKQVQESATVTACRDLRRDEESHSSLSAIRCRHCNGSFDALRNKVCPFCGHSYELKDLEWVITDLTN